MITWLCYLLITYSLQFTICCWADRTLQAFGFLGFFFSKSKSKLILIISVFIVLLGFTGFINPTWWSCWSTGQRLNCLVPFSVRLMEKEPPTSTYLSRLHLICDKLLIYSERKWNSPKSARKPIPAARKADGQAPTSALIANSDTRPHVC